MKTVRIGNDITIRWTLVFADSGETLAGKELKLYLKHPLITKREVTDYTVEDNAVTWVFRGAEQKKTGVYSLELVCNDGADGMWTIDACDAVELVPCTCKTGCPGGDVELFGKVDTLNGNVIVTAVDKELDAESENPIANMAVAKEIEALKENAGSSAFVVETAGNLILSLTDNSTSATILKAIGGDFNAIVQAIRDGRQIQFKNTTTGEIINAGLTGYSSNGSTESITIYFSKDYNKYLYSRYIERKNGVLRCIVCDRGIGDNVYIGSDTNIGGKCAIGDNVIIGGNVQIGTNAKIGSATIQDGVNIVNGYTLDSNTDTTGVISYNRAKIVFGSTGLGLKVYSPYDYNDQASVQLGCVQIGSGVEGHIGTGCIGIYGTSSYNEAICFQYGTTKVFLNNDGLLDKNGNHIGGGGGGGVSVGTIKIGFDGMYYTLQPINDEFNAITKIGTAVTIQKQITIQSDYSRNGIEIGDGIGTVFLAYN